MGENMYDDLFSILKQNSSLIEEEFLKFFSAGFKPKLLYKPIREFLVDGGKKARPTMCMLACEGFCSPPKDLVKIASAVELLHNFTLVHDDIIDNSDVRRTNPTMHKKYGVPIAILSGDVMFAYVFKIISGTSFSDGIKVRLVKLFSEKSIELGQGEVHQIEAVHSNTLDENVYARVAQKKTSALFDVAMLSGAIVGGATDDALEKLLIYSNKLGLAFQVRDDILDLTGEENIIGKKSGNDIKEGKRTLITIHALNHLPRDKSRVLSGILNIPARRTTDNDVRDAMALIHEADSIKFAQEFAENLGKEGIGALGVIPNERVRTVFVDLMNFAIQRDN